MKTLKKVLSAFVLIIPVFFNAGAQNQNVSINDNGNPPDASAILDVSSTTKGVLIPRMTTAQRNGITPIGMSQKGLLVYDTNLDQFWYFDGTQWMPIMGFTGGTGPQGPAGTDGVTGPQGLPGSAGANGATGPQGPAGTDGVTGPQGLPGSAGANGATGPQGPAGTNGVTGPQGLPGSAGANGATGLQGQAGSTGANGATGATGVTGPTGPLGCGSANYIIKSLGASATCSQIFDNGTSVSIGTATPSSSALLDINSINKGILIPNVALTGKTDATTIPSPATSLMVYNTATVGTWPNNISPGYYFNSGTPGSPNWSTFGSSGGKYEIPYENRFRVSAGTTSNYFFNSSNYGPNTYGDNTNPYDNDYLGGYYLANPASIPALNGIWYVSHTVTSPCYFTGYSGWGMVENLYDGSVGVTVTNVPTVTVYFYSYTPTNNFSGNITGTLIASGSVTLTKTFTSYQLLFAPASPVPLATGDIIIGYVKSSAAPNVSGTLSLIDIMGVIEFKGQ